VEGNEILLREAAGGHLVEENFFRRTRNEGGEKGSPSASQDYRSLAAADSQGLPGTLSGIQREENLIPH